MRFASLLPIFLSLVLFSGALFIGCDDDDDSSPTGPSNSDIVGTWDMTYYVFTDTTNVSFEIRPGNLMWFDWEFDFFAGDSGRYIMDNDTGRCEWNLTGSQLRLVDLEETPADTLLATVSGSTFTFELDEDDGTITYHFSKQ